MDATPSMHMVAVVDDDMAVGSRNENATWSQSIARPYSTPDEDPTRWSHNMGHDGFFFSNRVT